MKQMASILSNLASKFVAENTITAAWPPGFFDAGHACWPASPAKGVQVEAAIIDLD